MPRHNTAFFSINCIRRMKWRAILWTHRRLVCFSQPSHASNRVFTWPRPSPSSWSLGRQRRSNCHLRPLTTVRSHTLNRRLALSSTYALHPRHSTLLADHLVLWPRQMAVFACVSFSCAACYRCGNGRWWPWEHTMLQCCCRCWPTCST